MTSRAFAPLVALTVLASLLAFPAVSAAPSLAATTPISPTSGLTNGGTVVTITGSNFAPGAIVRFRDASGTFTATAIDSSSSGTLKATTPAHAPGPVDVLVINPDGSQVVSAASSNGNSGFTFVAAGAPTLSGVSPSSGSANANDGAGGTILTLTGTGFSTAIAPRVLFGTYSGGQMTNTAPATVLQPLSATQLIVVAPPRGALPASSSSSFAISVQNPDGSAPAVLWPAYTFLAQAPPTVAGVTPVSGSSNGGTLLTLTGAAFAVGATVSFVNHGGSNAANAASVNFISPAQLNAVTPPITDASPKLTTAAAGIDIVVTNPDGKSVTLSNAYTFSLDSVPHVSTLTPRGGPNVGGTLVTITGSNFAPGPRLQVLFGSTAATNVQFVNANKVTAVSPACASGCGTVTVENPDGSPSPEVPTFTYSTVVRIDSIQGQSSWTVATSGGGAALQLAGVGFPSPCRVLVAGVDATNPTCTSTTASFVPPPGLPGVRDVTIVGGAGTDGRGATLQGGLAYTLAAVPTITGVSVTNSASTDAQTAGSNGATASAVTTLTIAGTGFIKVQDALGNFLFPTVTIGTTTATVVSVNAAGTSIVVNVPPNPSVPTAGVAADVKVTNFDGQSITLPATSTSPPAFKYSQDGRPAVTSTCTLTPATCPTGLTTGGAGPITLSGTLSATPGNFVLGTHVLFGTADQPILAVCPGSGAPTVSCLVDSNTIKVFAPPTTSASTVSVNVRNPDGQVPAAAPSFSFVYTMAPAPKLTLSVNTLPANGGQLSIGTNQGAFVYGPLFSVTVDTTAIPACAASTLPVPYCIKATDVTGNSVTVTAPGHTSTGSGAVSVAVTNADGQSNAISGAITYSGTIPPSLNTVSPSNGAVGTVVTLTGSRFSEGPAARLPTVTVGGVAALVCTGTNQPLPRCVAPVNGATDTLSFVVPALTTPGAQSIVLTNPDQNFVTESGAFRSLALPSVTTVAPQTDTVNGGQTVTFTGTGFDPTSPPLLALFSPPGAASPARGSGFATPSTTQATAVVPAVGATGLTALYLVDQDGQALTLPSLFNYAPSLPPSFTSITPALASVNGNAPVAIAGSGFAPGATVCLRAPGATTVTLGVVSPPCTAGSAGYVATPVTVTVPTAGSSGLAAGVATLSFLTPSHAAGPVDVVITNPAGFTSTDPTHPDTLLLPASQSVFAFTQVATPVLSSVSPSSGDAAGGTAVTLAGFNFGSTGSTTVTFNNTLATSVVVVSPNSITAKTPPGTAGPVKVTVTSYGIPFTLPNAFTYTASATSSTTTSTSTSNPTGNPTGGTTGPTPTPGPITNDQIIAANKAVRVTVTRDGNDNVVSFILPSNLPGTPAGVQVFRSNSPYVLLTTLQAGSPAYVAHTYRDVGAPLASTYKVTVFYQNGVGKATSDPSQVPGFDQISGVQSDAVQQDFYTKLAFGIGVLALLIIVLLVVLVRRRGRAQPAYAGSDVGYVAPATPPEGQGEAPPAAPSGQVHTVNCPVCKGNFEAVGEKPLRMKCPNCGREGILR